MNIMPTFFSTIYCSVEIKTTAAPAAAAAGVAAGCCWWCHDDDRCVSKQPDISEIIIWHNYGLLGKHPPSEKGQIGA